MSTCICGIPQVGPMCIHCDTPRVCPPNCPACTIRDSICPICRAHQGTPAARNRHETACRAVEASTERGMK